MILAASNLSLQGFHPTPGVITLILVGLLFWWTKRQGLAVWLFIGILVAGVMVAVAYPQVAVQVSSIVSKL